MTEGIDESSDSRAAPRRARPAKQAPTIYDIAQLAGVNPSTVSRALSKPGRISARTEKLIQDAAKTLNYRVNPMARALPTGRTSTLGLIVADITNPVFFTFIRGAEQAAAQAGYTLVLAESHESGEREVETTERIAPSVDGLVLVATRLTDEQIVALSARKTLIVVNRSVEGVETIVPDLEPGVDRALMHLSDLGHSAIAYLSGPDDSWMSVERWRLMLSKALDQGMTIVEIGPGAPTVEGGRDMYERVIASGVTAVLAYNDLMAIGLLRAAQERGLTVPGRLSVVGFDDIFGSDFTSPPLSTIRIPLGLMGLLAVRRILDLIGEGTHDDPTIVPNSPLTVVPQGGQPLLTEFVRRGSTGPVAR
jgi:LacI family transcriptional regulator